MVTKHLQKYFLRSSTLFAVLVFCIFNTYSQKLSATNRTSVNSGNFNSPTTWVPAGIPTASDNIIILNNHTITVDNTSNALSVTVNDGGKLVWLTGKKLTIQNGFTVNGTAELIEGDIDLIQANAPFKIGPVGIFTWQPANNTVAGATLFTNGKEEFTPTSTLVIAKWYNYNNVPLGAVVNGNFGNVTLTTLTNGLLFEWNQNNNFEQHKILGTLTIDQGWIVLDKSGSISNTTIGAINLKNVNSYFDLHSGDHPGSFTVKTGSLTNIGGVMNGLLNGNGNINLEVTGDVLNLGNIELIYNSGVQGAGNGNASMKVTGLYRQTHGDFRGIFNLSSTNTGSVNLEFANMQIEGGVFMAQYACHTASALSTITVNNNLVIDFINATSKFRGNGLSSLGGVNSNLRQLFTVKGNLTIKGNAAAEFTSSGSGGMENFKVNGVTIFEGCVSNFNYGDHTTQLEFDDSVTTKGGIVNLSKTTGTLTAIFNSSLIITSGELNTKCEAGNANIVVNGNYFQSGGTFNLHNNLTQAADKIIYMTINGDYTNISGTFSFDNNSASTAKHVLSLNGDKFTIGGLATITGAVSSSNPQYSTIYFDNSGEIVYYENSTSAKIQNIKQVISSGCTVKIMYGNMQAASSNLLVNDMIRIAPGGCIDAGTKQIYSNGIGLYSAIKIENNARLRTSNPEGLYNGAANATIKANGNFTFQLQPTSIVEYYGNANQSVTGTGVGTAQSIDQQYGVLEINKDGGVAKLNSSTINVRTAIDLPKGELQLNGYNIAVHSGSPLAITTVNGYIKSETMASNTKGLVIWKNMEAGNHVIPFGISPDKMIPFSFTPISGLAGDLAISTRACSKDNRPLNPGVTNININNTDVSSDKVIDRWYYISAPGMTANVVASYLPEENTTGANLANKNFSAMNWNVSKWDIIGGNGNGSTLNTGNVAIANNSKWGNLLLISNEKLEQADILTFEANLDNKRVDVKWTALPNVNVLSYTVEKSTDGYNFHSVIERTALSPSTTPLAYTDVDPQALKGISFYRLRQNNPDGKQKYSENVRIENIVSESKGLELIASGPNPFNSEFNIAYSIPNDGVIEIRLTSINGQIAYSNSIRANAGKNSTEISELEGLVPGVYILTITDGKSTKNYKMFKI